MGCGSSKITVVQPVGSCKFDEEDRASQQDMAIDRGDSAVSKFTTDSGVELETGEVPTLPGAMYRKLQSLSDPIPGLPHEIQRPRSSEILKQLLSQGIIPAPPTARPYTTGEAYDIMMDNPLIPRRRPPARLESLKALKDHVGNSKEEIEEKMRQAEERRKVKEEELRLRLRSKSARVRTRPTPVEVLQNKNTRTCPGKYPGDPSDQDSLLHTHIESREAGEDVREVGGGREGGEDSREAGGDSRQSEELGEASRSGHLLMASLNIENDSTFQQNEQVEEFF